MSDVTRGQFLGIGAATVAALGAGSVNGARIRAAPQADADLVVLNGRIYTVDPALPVAEALAVKHDRFVAVGSSADVRDLVGPGTRVIDASGMTVTPGFIDAHSHPSGGGLSALVNVDTNLGSIARIKEALSERARSTPAGEWVQGYMYDDTKLSEGRPLLRTDLDEVSTEHPIVVGHRGGHTGVYNSKAFEMAGVTADTPDPFGGHFYREDGQLTGKVAERARAMINRLIPSEVTRAERQAGIARISEMMAAVGLTSVHQTHAGVDDFIAYQDARAAGELLYRAYVFASGAGAAYRDMKAAGIRSGFGDEWVRIGGVKYVADGSASERTMRMSTPYVGRSDDYGILTMTQEEIHEVVEEAHRAGWQVGIHANGDVTIDLVLNAYERVLERWPREDPRHRIEHCSLVNPSLLRRIKDTGSIPTPFYTYVHYHGNKWVEYGPEKMRWMFAHRSFLDYEIPVAPASDYTPGPFEPLMAIQSMVTRKDFDGRVWGPNQRVTVDEALRICTLNGAYASFEESEKGSISVGKLADFVILAADPHHVEPDAIKEIAVLRTVVGGRTTFEA
jgi:predicted amidohydrolase YtcJ